MLYSDKIPEALKETNNTEKFVKVLDELQKFKEVQLFRSSRLWNPVLLTNLVWYKKILEEYGWPTIPYDFPKEILDNMWLNSENVFALAGSNLGLDYLLRVLTCGLPIINSSQFIPKPSYVIPNDLDAGYFFSTQDYPNKIIYLYNGVDIFLNAGLAIQIQTPYYQLQSLKDYITKNIYKFIGFVDINTVVNITFVNGPYVPNPYANQYFVNP